MKKTSARLFLIFFLSGIMAPQVSAQPDPPTFLADFVNDPRNGATNLQQQVGNAVQKACGALFGEGGFNLTGAAGDLFERCNEMVHTAASYQGIDLGRSLEIAPDDLLAVMQQVGGEELNAQGTMSTRVTNGQFSNIAGRLNAVRIGGSSVALGARVAALGTYDDPERNSPAYQDVSIDGRVLSGGGAAGEEDIAGSRWGWFLEGSYNTGDRDETVLENGFDFDASSFTLGIDYLLSSGVIGASIGIDSYEAKFNPSMVVSGGDVKVDGTSGSLFGAFFSDRWYFDGIVSFGSLDSETSRVAVYASNNNNCQPVACPGVNADLIGDTDGDFLSAGFSVGYDYQNGNWSITPQLSIAYRDIGLDGYEEVDPLGGGLSLEYDKQEIKSLKSILGIAFTGAYSRDFGILSPHLRAEWHHEFEDDPARLFAKYAVENQLATQGVQGAAGAGVFGFTNCISCFLINGEEIDTDFGVLGVGLSAVFSRRIQLYGMIDSLVGLDHLSSTLFSVGIRGQF